MVLKEGYIFSAIQWVQTHTSSYPGHTNINKSVFLEQTILGRSDYAT